MLQILASFAEFERNTIIENVYNGQRQRAIEGYYQGNLPLGYDKVPDSKKELMINQHEANIVKYIFESYAKGHGYRKIANALNHKGYVTKKAKPFSISSITYIISNPFTLERYSLRSIDTGAIKDEKDSMKNRLLQMVNMRL